MRQREDSNAVCHTSLLHSYHTSLLPPNFIWICCYCHCLRPNQSTTDPHETQQSFFSTACYGPGSDLRPICRDVSSELCELSIARSLKDHYTKRTIDQKPGPSILSIAIGWFKGWCKEDVQGRQISPTLRPRSQTFT